MARGGLFSSDKTNKSRDYGIRVFFAICDEVVDTLLEQRTRSHLFVHPVWWMTNTWRGSVSTHILCQAGRQLWRLHSHFLSFHQLFQPWTQWLIPFFWKHYSIALNNLHIYHMSTCSLKQRHNSINGDCVTLVWVTGHSTLPSIR